MAKTASRVGHAGPADWCYWAVYTLLAALSLAAYTFKATRK